MNEFAHVSREGHVSRSSRPPLRVRGDIRQSTWPAVVLIGVDVFAIELALGLGCALRSALVPWWPISIGFDQILALADGLLIMPVAYYLVGLHPGYGLGPVERLRKRILTTAVVFGILISWDRLVGSGDWSRGVLLLTFCFALILVPTFEALARRLLIRWHFWGNPVAIFGASETGVKVAKMLLANPQLGWVPIGFFDDRLQKHEGRVEPVEIRGGIDEAKLLYPSTQHVIIAIPNASAARLNEIISRAPFTDVTIIPNLIGFQALWVSARDLNGVLGLSVKRNLLLHHNQVVKRITDVVLGGIVVVFALPIIALFALLVKIIDPGPAFCTQERIGEHGRPFKMLKLRSMRVDAEQWLVEYLARDSQAREEWARYMKLRNDPRILPIIGQFMRTLSIDELPQLWHVIRGDMSLVGPRPFPEYHVAQFDPDFRRLRASVRPGLTGLWQVSSRSEGDLKVQEVQDTYFIRNWSPWLDLYVLIQTFYAVLGTKGAR